MNWFKRIFHAFDRTESHAERLDAAFEGMADDMEEARKRLRNRLGLEEVSEQAKLPAPAATNGRRAPKDK